jgi:lipoyl(octanoyl) transferase
LIAPAPPLRWTWLGRAPYRPVWERQEAIRERVLAGDPDAERLLLVEHDPVVTLGRSARPANLLLPEGELARRGVELVRTSRGGDVTYHGPGQLVVYPVVRLARGVVAHVEAVGRALAEELATRGIEGAEWRRDPAGVWIGDAKIAACGIHVRRRVAIHGFALNVGAAPLEAFRWIVPCGLAGARVTSIEAERPGTAPPLPELAASIARRIARTWGREPLCSCDRGAAR